MSDFLTAEDLSISFGGIKAVDGVSMSIDRGEILSIIGPNGAGKTTFFNLISGIYVPSSGRVRLKGEDATGLPPHRLARRGLCRTFQNLQVFFRMTALENVMVGRQRHERTSFIAHFLSLPSVALENAETYQQACAYLDFIDLRAQSNMAASAMSYGALKRLEIARALASEPEVLLLDEPAAGCNAVETQQIANLIVKVAARGIAIVLVEHDMKLVMQISHRILVLDQGRTLCQGTPAAVRSDPRVREVYLGSHGMQEARVA